MYKYIYYELFSIYLVPIELIFFTPYEYVGNTKYNIVSYNVN